MFCCKQNNVIFIVLFVALLSACSEMPKRWDMHGYTVKSGDTLYSIAWRYEKDFRQLAQLNQIKSPYAIHPGQRIQMEASNKDGTILDHERTQVLTDEITGETLILESPESIKANAEPKIIVVKQYETLYGIAGREGLTHHQIARWNHLKSPYTLRPGQKLRLSPSANALGGNHLANKKAKAKKSIVQPKTTPLKRRSIQMKPIVAVKKLPRKIDTWYWPAKGRIVQTFKTNDTARKGIGISGKLGQSVKAAAAGQVVYSGNGLINYGNLVIIKHSHSFLSAYAYNQSLSVKEGQSVKQGQVIAKMGKYDSAKPQLHFEIRRNGKPVNPLHYLPKS